MNFVLNYKVDLKLIYTVKIHTDYVKYITCKEFVFLLGQPCDPDTSTRPHKQLMYSLVQYTAPVCCLNIKVEQKTEELSLCFLLLSEIHVCKMPIMGSAVIYWFLVTPIPLSSLCRELWESDILANSDT